MTKEEFIEKSIKKHGDKYDYSKVEYVNCKTKVCIICPEHGEFWQTPDNHYRQNACPICATKNRWDNRGRISTDIFIKNSQKIHGDKYDYSKVEYINNRTKVCIICPEHGEFWQQPVSHLNGCGCPMCKREKLKNERIVDYTYFLKNAEKVHNNKYKYIKDTYQGLTHKVKIICPEHGEFWQIARLHLNGCGCKKCANLYMDKDFFIEKARKIHGDKYDYSKVEYKNAKTKVCIICPEHGEFWQTPDKHLGGQGCDKCNMSHLERETMQALEKYGIKYEYQKKFKWSKRQIFDFFLPSYNIVLECQGVQHFKPTDFAGKGMEWAKKEFQKNIKRDTTKKQMCECNNLDIHYINYDENIEDKIKKILSIYDNKNNCL